MSKYRMHLSLFKWGANFSILKADNGWKVIYSLLLNWDYDLNYNYGNPKKRYRLRLRRI